MKTLTINVTEQSGTRSLELTPSRLIVAGWTGRDRAAVKKHIEELGQLGIPAPTRTPTFMNLSPDLLTTDDRIEVVSPASSGEVEAVVFVVGGKRFVGVGSDHTDREFEKYGIPASKQMCAKPIAPAAWDYDDIKEHWDRLLLRSWMTIKGEKALYQESPLTSLLSHEEVSAQMPSGDGLPEDGLIIFGGTPATKSGLVYGQRFDFEIEDPVLKRSIRHGYDVRVLPQYL